MLYLDTNKNYMRRHIQEILSFRPFQQQCQTFSTIRPDSTTYNYLVIRPIPHIGHPVFIHSIAPYFVMFFFIRSSTWKPCTHAHLLYRFIRYSGCRHWCCLVVATLQKPDTLIYKTENVDLIFGYKINWYSITRNLNLDNKWPLKWSL